MFAWRRAVSRCFTSAESKTLSPLFGSRKNRNNSRMWGYLFCWRKRLNLAPASCERHNCSRGYKVTAVTTRSLRSLLRSLRGHYGHYAVRKSTCSRLRKNTQLRSIVNFINAPKWIHYTAKVQVEFNKARKGFNNVSCLLQQ